MESFAGKAAIAWTRPKDCPNHVTLSAERMKKIGDDAAAMALEPPPIPRDLVFLPVTPATEATMATAMDGDQLYEWMVGFVDPQSMECLTEHARELACEQITTWKVQSPSLTRVALDAKVHTLVTAFWRAVAPQVDQIVKKEWHDYELAQKTAAAHQMSQREFAAAQARASSPAPARIPRQPSVTSYRGLTPVVVRDDTRRAASPSLEPEAKKIKRVSRVTTSRAWSQLFTDKEYTTIEKGELLSFAKCQITRGNDGRLETGEQEQEIVIEAADGSATRIATKSTVPQAFEVLPHAKFLQIFGAWHFITSQVDARWTRALGSHYAAVMTSRRTEREIQLYDWIVRREAAHLIHKIKWDTEQPDDGHWPFEPDINLWGQLNLPQSAPAPRPPPRRAPAAARRPRQPQQPQSQLDPKKKRHEKCKYFEAGNCRRGDQCPFVHETATPATA